MQCRFLPSVFRLLSQYSITKTSSALHTEGNTWYESQVVRLNTNLPPFYMPAQPTSYGSPTKIFTCPYFTLQCSELLILPVYRVSQFTRIAPQHCFPLINPLLISDKYSLLNECLSKLNRSVLKCRHLVLV